MTTAPLPKRAESSTLFLVSCVSQKRSTPSRARDLYTSDWFKKARSHVASKRGRWFILSAEYGLLDPDTIVAPYERTLNRMTVAQRRTWASGVLKSVHANLAGVERVVFLAGERYREFLVEPIRSLGLTVEVPMAGLKIGEQLHFLAEHARERA